jgi:hypothetical protein
MDRDNLWKLWFIVVIPAFFILIYGISMYEDNHYNKYYTYVDLDNNEGIAYECKYTDKAYKSGGMGTPICKLEDGTILSVKSYKYHKEIK